MSYQIYHIPGKKVGISKNVKKRLGEQGYTLEQVEILGAKENCINALRRERTLNKQLNYKPDGFFHPDMFKMKYRTYEGNTIGFPVEKEEFIEWLDDHPNITLSTMKEEHGFVRGDEGYEWLKMNVKKSKFPDGNLKTFIYCEALDVFAKNNLENGFIKHPSLDGLISNIYDWANDRGILDGSIETQTLKLGEEFGELQKAVLKDKPEDIKDAIGDIIVVLVSIAHFNGHSVADAVQMAYDTISKRTGFTNSKGDFIKTHFEGKVITETL